MNQENLIIETLSVPDDGKGLIITAGVRVTHKPTGIVAECKHMNTQRRNLNVAISMVESGVKEIQILKWSQK